MSITDCGCHQRLNACFAISESGRDRAICSTLKAACDRSCAFYTRNLNEDSLERLVDQFIGQNVITLTPGNPQLFTSARPDIFLIAPAGAGRFPPGALSDLVIRNTIQGPMGFQGGASGLDLPSL